MDSDSDTGHHDLLFAEQDAIALAEGQQVGMGDVTAQCSARRYGRDTEACLSMPI